MIAIFHKSQSKNKDFICPTCNQKQKDISSENDIKNLIKNFNLLRIVEKIENRKTIQNQVSPSEDKNRKTETKNFQINEEKNDQYTEQKCKKHNANLYLLALGTNMLLCDLCVKETNIKAYPIPGLIKDFKRKYDSSFVKINLINSEIDRLHDFYTSYEDEFMKVNKRKLDNLFDYLHKVVEYNYNSSVHILHQCKKEQVDQITSKISELTNLKNDLKNIESELKHIVAEDEKEIFKNNEKLNKIYSKLNYFLNYELELNLLTMKIGLKDENKNNLISLIQECYYLDVEFASIKGESPTIQDILQKEKYWICVCGESNNLVNTVICSYCGLLRKIESFSNILTNPKLANPTEINQLILRRKEECRIFQENIKSIDKDKSGLYYALDIEWFLLWKCFVTNDFSEKYLPNSKKKMSVNLSIGVLQPGPISNSFLFEKGAKEFNEKSLRKGLKKNEDYIVVGEELWNFFFENYNGGPEITFPREKDIYSSKSRMIAENYSSKTKKSVLYDESYVTQDLHSFSKIEEESNTDFLQQTYLNNTEIGTDSVFEDRVSKLEETISMFSEKRKK